MPKNSSPRTAYSPRYVPGTKSQNWSSRNSLDIDHLRRELAHHRDRTYTNFSRRHPHAATWLKNRQLDLGKIREHSQKLLAGASLSTALMLSAPTSPQALPQPSAAIRLADAGIIGASALTQTLHDQLSKLVPQRVGRLDPDAEIEVSAIIKKYLGLTAASTLAGQRLNHSLGWIGYEQHLYRFPGDSLGQHDALLASGIAPHTGGWGYFASSRSVLTQQLIDYEKYYVAVQTLYLPNWQQDLAFLRDWYKFRKVLVINLENGESVVAVIGDAGPAEWTGKQFGGSPEVMQALDLTGKKSKGKVLLFFVDDPDNKVPVGPIKGPVGEDIQLT